MLALTRHLLHRTPTLPFVSMRRASLSGKAQPRSAKSIQSHQERTATEPREKDFHTAIIAQVTPVNDRIKKFRFNLQDSKAFNVISTLPMLSTYADT